MNKRFQRVFVVILGLVFASVAHADSVNVGSPVTNTTLTINDQTLTNLGYTHGVTAYIDPYHGTFDGNSVLLFCVDPDHFDGSGTYNVNVSTPGGSWSTTEQVIYHGDTSAQANTLYEEEAYLAQLLNNTPASSVQTQQEIQAAIWQLADPTLTYTVPTGDTGFANDVSKDLLAASQHPLTSGFEILTDSSCTTKSNCTNTRQEYLVLTPEPSSLALLGLGLGVFFRRRSRGLA